jgi:vanillate O-demethylase ferredoxin subunit
MTVSPATPLRVRIARKSIEADAVAGFELVSPDGAPLPPFTAGSHVDVLLEAGLTRQYSLCNAPHERHRYCIGVLREPDSRGGSAFLHDRVDAGDTLSISVPRNHFPLDEHAARSVLLAGGIGITPLLAMAERLSALGAPFELHHCVRTAARAAYRTRLAAAPFAHAVRHHFDDGDPAQRLDLSALLDAPASSTHLYVCGPLPFLDLVRRTARDRGWADRQVHFEYFGGATAHAADDDAFDVVLQDSGRTVRVAGTQTIVEALATIGIEVPVSCQQGVCGTCLTRVVDGEVDHRDLYLSVDEQAANDQMLPCCSRAKGRRLVLAL